MPLWPIENYCNLPELSSQNKKRNITKMDNNITNENNFSTEESAQPKKKSIVFPIILGALLIAGGFYGYSEYKHAQEHQETDDAQIATNMAPVISRISGYINEVKVHDNQFVKKGDTLLVLDNRDQKILLQQAEAGLATAMSNVAIAKAGTVATSENINTTQAAVASAEAQIDAAKVNVWKTTQDLNRYSILIKDHSITQQQYEQVLAAKQAADKQLNVLVQQKKQAAQQINVATSQTHASSQHIGAADAVVKQRQVEIENAKLNLSYTVVVAPDNGYVAKVPVQPGQFVQAGAQLFSLVRDNKIWVVANFKETQLTKMQVGQKVKVEVDAYPDQKLEGVVTSLSPATGSSFSLLPPDNATGNFVKVVQRVPVRIDFVNLDKNTAKKLRAGMNVSAEVEFGK